MRYLVSVVALALCACGSADNVVSAGAASSSDNTSSTSVTNSVNSNTSSNVRSSTNVGSTTTMNSTSSNSSTTSCSTENNGRRCEVSCSAPLVAQCVKSSAAAAPTCHCQ